MSLDYDLTNIQNRTTAFPPGPDDTLNAELQSLIFLTMATGINHIDDANANEFWIRADLWQKAIGPQFNRIDDGGSHPVYVTRRDVYNGRGLATNASTLTRRRFLDHLFATRTRIG